MSKRATRREAERLARKLAYQQLRQPLPAPEPVTPEVEQTVDASDLLTRAQAFFNQPSENKPLAATSHAKIEANRTNSRRSTGPITPEGKAIASRNRTTHGLTAEPAAENFKVLPNENQAAYDQSVADFHSEWCPHTATERDLVNRLVMHQWLRLRAMRLQETLFSSETGEVSEIKKFELYRRYETTHERGFNKCLADLQRLRSFQLRQQNGFESQKRKNEEHALKMRRLQSIPALQTDPLPLTPALHSSLGERDALSRFA